MGSPTPIPMPAEGSLPRSLWVGTFVFVVAAAGVLSLVLHLGAKNKEVFVEEKTEVKAVELTQAEQERADIENRKAPQ